MSRALQWAVLGLILGWAWKAQAVTIETVAVGNAGNAPDYLGHGAVDHAFRIAKYEVTNAQYTEFLNAVDPSGSNALGLHHRPGPPYNVGIELNPAAPNGAKYELWPGSDNYPVARVTWYDAIRFVNWLHNGQGSGDTETGAYTLPSAVADPPGGEAIARNASARWFLPTENEWYKAAYHRNDGASGNYWKYPTASDNQPYSAPPPGDSAPDASNTANFLLLDNLYDNGYNDGFAVTNDVVFHLDQNYLTPVGAYTHSPSSYGTFDQGGNVSEWLEDLYTPTSTPYRRIRGGSAFDHYFDMISYFAGVESASAPTGSFNSQGFRVATIVPEPASTLLMLPGALAWAVWRRRCRER